MTTNIIEKFKAIHGNKYDYSKVEYRNTHEKVCIICPEHGEFWQTPHNHLKGRGCQKCAKINSAKKRRLQVSDFINKARKIHNDKYDYSKVEYVNSQTPVCITCPEHGEFWQTPSNHLKGKGCLKCSYIKRKKSQTYTAEEFIKKAKLAHSNKYDYSKVEYVNSQTPVCIICPEHGEFWQEPASHLSGCGCPFCAGNAKLTTETFIKKAKEIHGNKYDYSKVEYINSQTPVCIICPEHGEFWQIPNNHLSKKYDCPKCNAVISKKEKEVADFIKTLTNEKIIENDKNVIKPFELDLYIPSLSLAIEFDGLRWHSEEFNVPPKYHLTKTKMCEKMGIRLLHIFEDEWDAKQNIVKDILSNFIKKSDAIYARKCTVREISAKNAKEFIENNHIQGSVSSKINIGLFSGENLVSVMTFGGLRTNLGRKTKSGSFELLRYATKLGSRVIGGASKMFKYFLKRYDPEEIVSYSDNRFFSGGLYKKLGFTFKRESPPNYFYIVGHSRMNRFKYRKDRLVAEGYNASKTEHQIMIERGIYRIYDCGCKVWEYKK